MKQDPVIQPILTLPMEARAETIMVLNEALQERLRQDRLWGGPHHDDRHDAEDWLEILAQHFRKVEWENQGANRAGYRKELVQCAALCLAALESLDRQLHEKEITHDPADI